MNCLFIHGSYELAIMTLTKTIRNINQLKLFRNCRCLLWFGGESGKDAHFPTVSAGATHN